MQKREWVVFDDVIFSSVKGKECFEIRCALNDESCRIEPKGERRRKQSS